MSANKKEVIVLAEYNLLLIDDEVHIRRVVSFYLGTEGYNVIGAAHTYEGWAKYNAAKRGEAPALDMVITDFDTGGDLSGIGLTRRIRASGDDIPVILHTARSLGEVIGEAGVAGVTAISLKHQGLLELKKRVDFFVRYKE